MKSGPSRAAFCLHHSLFFVLEDGVDHESVIVRTDAGDEGAGAGDEIEAALIMLAEEHIGGQLVECVDTRIDDLEAELRPTLRLDVDRAADLEVAKIFEDGEDVRVEDGAADVARHG